MRKNKENSIYKKGKHLIVFYDQTDYIYEMFDSISDICLYKHLEITQGNMRLIQTDIFNALRREDHSTRMLNGKLLHVYLIDTEEKSESEL